MLQEQFSKWLHTLLQIVWAEHDSDCARECPFCLHCGDLVFHSVGVFVRHMLCPAELRFAGFSRNVLNWSCVANE